MAKQQVSIINLVTVNEAKILMTDHFPTMVTYFLEDTEMYLQEIERGVQEKNAELAISPAHTIKSSAKQLGAEQVSNVAKEIEELCRNIIDKHSSDFTQFEQLCLKLKSEIDAATPELKKLCE